MSTNSIDNILLILAHQPIRSSFGDEVVLKDLLYMVRVAIPDVVSQHSRLSLSRSPRDSLKYSQISVAQNIRLAELRKKYIKQPHFTHEHVI